MKKKKQGKEFTNLPNASLTRSHVYDTATGGGGGNLP